MPPRVRAGAALTLANLLWATTYTASALALSIGAGRLAALRFVIAGLLVLAFVLRAGLPKGKLLLQAAGLGVLGFSVAFGLQLLGVVYAGATLAALSIALEPLATALVARLLLKERLSRLMMPVAFPLAVAGTWLLAGSPMPGHDAHFLGIVFLLLATVSYGFYNVLGKPLAHAIGEFRLTGIGTIAAAVTLIPFLFIGPWPNVQTGDWIAIVYLGLGPTLASYSLWYYAVRRVPVGFAAFFLYVQPIAGAALGWIWLGQGLSLLQLSGGLLILAGVYFGVREGRAEEGVAA